ncbi:type IX secretion system membrane protein PorP/SprF [Polaribacter aestuariivivens]|uniref:Type IX secretion system membrane protein PorP/SprF n=1 Tax=Polaribacter aestuariivivens TaxID=2304626 RepID=A0A5S3N3Q0_9FLAO|nr:type IX secretion system membrane protein PorP/SprF [Polaribacter aestuariivivens]TMM29900.1 type IX secretion system membrane protein PorP/SprF [Polaribacter aestuariivivens]
MKKIYIIVICIITNLNLFSQENNLPQYLNYMGDNPFVITPAYAGIGTGLRIRINGMSQWLGVKNAPDTQSFSIESRIGDRFGGGLVVFNDRNGNTTQQGAKITFASHLTLSRFNDSFFSFGFTYSYNMFRIDTNNFSGSDSSVIDDRSVNSSNFDVSFLYRFNHYGISLNISNILDKDEATFTNGEPLVLRRYTVFNYYIFNKFSANYEFEPSVFVEYFEADKRSRTDLNLKLRKKTNDGYIWAGISYNFLNDQFLNPNSVAPIVGIKKGNFYASYGFGINTNKTQAFNVGSHMITLGFDFVRSASAARCTQKYYIFQ